MQAKNGEKIEPEEGEAITEDLACVSSIDKCDNYVPQWWVELDDELSWLLTNRFSATRYMKVKRLGIEEILRRIWLFSTNKIKSSESGSKQPTQLIVELNSSLRHIIVSKVMLNINLNYNINSWILLQSVCLFWLRGFSVTRFDYNEA